MTRRTELEAALTAAQQNTNEIVKKLHTASRALKGAGYVETAKRHDNGSLLIVEETVWEKSEHCRDAEYAEYRSAYSKGFGKGFTEALELVIKALEIPGYTSFVHADETKLGSKVHATLYAADRFQADLETALRVRAEKAKDAEDAAIEARVAKLGKKAAK